MASAQSSQKMCCSRGRQPQLLGNAQPRQRSESSRLSDRRRPMTVARKSDHCPGALHEGDAVRVFSRSADKWVDGEVVKFFKGGCIRVEYEIGDHWCGKTVHVHSDCLVISSATASMSEEDGVEQNLVRTSSDLQLTSHPFAELTSDPRWLLSCRYDVDRQAGRYVQWVVKFLGENVVNNPNRFSKTCCTIDGETWDENYNKGQNAEKYRRCWEPNAPKDLKCTKGESTFDCCLPTKWTCWKFSYFWRLKRSKKMLRLLEAEEDLLEKWVKCPHDVFSGPGFMLGEGQEIEKAMAEFLQNEPGGCQVREINCTYAPDTEDCEQTYLEELLGNLYRSEFRADLLPFVWQYAKADGMEGHLARYLWEQMAELPLGRLERLAEVPEDQFLRDWQRYERPSF